MRARFMRIYVDFDDVICETAKALSVIANRLFGVDVPFERIRHFDLRKSFGLDAAQYDRLMKAAHEPEAILAYEEIPGASCALRKWKAAGHEVEVVTGRPFSTCSASLEWLASHGLADLPVIHVDKYGREPEPLPGEGRSLTLEEFSRLRYDFAVEDSPAALEHLAKMDGCRVAVFSRPWNVNVPLPGPMFTRADGWGEVAFALAGCQGEGR